MIIKKYQGKTEEEAVALGRAELGQTVVVLNVKDIKPKGLFKFFKKKMVEVTIALEDQPDKSGQTKASTTTTTATQQETKNDSQALPKAENDKNPAVKPLQVSTVGRAGAAKAYSSQVINDKQVKGADYEEKAISDGRNGKVLEEKLESLHTLIEQQLVKDEVASEEFKEDDQIVTFLKLIYNTLLENEVAEKYANELIDEIERIKKPNVTVDFLLANIYQKMILMFGQPSVITPAKEGARIVFFIGPTGVGKTTTIAKIASSLSVNEKKKVTLLTTDTYRIAAAEQLRTYANILDAPFRVIYSSEEMSQAVEDYKDSDYILIDTAGHSHNNESQKKAMEQFVESVENTENREVYLVVSATTKYRDLVSIAEAYSNIGEYKLIFTKLDETTTLGNLFNLRLHTKANMSYITCGQNVPDDIEQFSPQSTVKKLLGGKN